MYKVCIQTAGLGTRNYYSNFIHKALLPLGHKPAICHIIDRIPEDVEIVIATGHFSEAVEAFVKLFYPDREITYVYVGNYQGKGSGPGYSLLQCSPYLQCPFIFVACDTIVLQDYPEPNMNWIGVHVVKDTREYLTVEIEKYVIGYYDKLKNSPSNIAFIGLAGVKDCETFWGALGQEVVSGLKAIKEVKGIGFTWFDTGSTEGYEKAYRYFASLPK